MEEVGWMTKEEAIEKGVCLSCRKEVNRDRNHEFEITGLCAKCLEDIFGSEDVEED